MVKKSLRFLIPGIILLYLISAFFQARSEKTQLENFKPLGKLIEIRGRKMHLYCQGDSKPGKPIVILEAGTGDNHLTWYGLQQRIRRDIKVCSYDRLGYGWSDSFRGSRTVDQIAEELHELLAAAQIPPPYVLAGHSYGGIVVRYFAARYPETVNGIVFIDATPPVTLLSRQSGIRQPMMLVPPALTGLAALMQGAGLVHWLSERGLFEPFEVLAYLPPEIRSQAEALYFRSNQLAASAVEQLYLRRSASLTANLSLPDDLAVVAFISDLEGVSEMLPNIQAEFSSLSSNSQVNVLPYGHYLHLERPDLILAAIENMALAENPL